MHHVFVKPTTSLKQKQICYRAVYLNAILKFDKKDRAHLSVPDWNCDDPSPSWDLEKLAIKF